MASKPKKQDYKPSAAEQAEARISAERAEFFNQNYAHLIAMELRASLTDDIKNLARGRGNADVMQGLTSNPNYQMTQQAGDYAKDLSGAFQSTLGQATAGAKDIQNKRAAAAVGSAQGQSAASANSMSLLTNIGTNRVLDKAKNKLLTKQAKLDAGMKIGGMVGKKMFGSGDKDDPNAADDFFDYINRSS